MTARSVLGDLLSALRRDTPAFGPARKVVKDLRGENLRGENLRGWKLEDAQLNGAHLEEADLTGADLENADLTGAFLEGTNLVDARLQRALLARSVWSRSTAWPPSVGDLVRRGSEEVAPGRYRVTENFRVPAS